MRKIKNISKSWKNKIVKQKFVKNCPSISSPEPLVESREGATDTEDGDHSERKVGQEDAEQDQSWPPEWRPLIGPDLSRYSALIGGASLCWCHNNTPQGRCVVRRQQ